MPMPLRLRLSSRSVVWAATSTFHKSAYVSLDETRVLSRFLATSQSKVVKLHIADHMSSFAGLKSCSWRALAVPSLLLPKTTPRERCKSNIENGVGSRTRLGCVSHPDGQKGSLYYNYQTWLARPSQLGLFRRDALLSSDLTTHAACSLLLDGVGSRGITTWTTLAASSRRCLAV